MSTLKFAQRVSTVELGEARANKESSEVLELKSQLESLKKALSNREIVTPPGKRFKEAVKTPLQSKRRLSIENGPTPTPKKAAKTPSTKPKQAAAERTPPRIRRLSIENGDIIKVAKTPPTTARSRRLSLEGMRNANRPEVVPGEVRCSQNIARAEDGKSKNFSGLSNNQRTPLSPLSLSHIKSPIVRIDTATIKVVVPPPSFKVPKTPETQFIKPKSEIQSVLHNDRKIGSENQTPCSTQGKGGSQFRKSLRTIGKFINGSEKRNQQKPTEAKSPTSSNARVLRRQSLTGIQPPEGSKRSSLGGASTDHHGNPNRTPPHIRSSEKSLNRWL